MIKNKLIEIARAEVMEAAEGWDDMEIDRSLAPETAKHNRSCFLNAVEQVKHRKAVAVIEVLGGGVAHYINMDQSGKTYDVTLGWNWSSCKYKVSEFIHPDDYDDTKTLAKFKDRLWGMLSKKTRVMCKMRGLNGLDLF